MLTYGLFSSDRIVFRSNWKVNEQVWLAFCLTTNWSVESESFGFWFGMKILFMECEQLEGLECMWVVDAFDSRSNYLLIIQWKLASIMFSVALSSLIEIKLVLNLQL